MGKLAYGGLRPDTDEIYKGGWTILTGRNLRGNYASRSEKSSEPETGAQTGQVKAIPGGGVIQPQFAINSQSDWSSSTGQNIRYFFGNLAANARLGYFREYGSFGSGGVQPWGTLPCF